jgi:hypothetical protein
MSTSLASRPTTTGSPCSTERQRDERVRTFRYLIHDRVLDYARLGWTILDTMTDCLHGKYSDGMALRLLGCRAPEVKKRPPFNESATIAPPGYPGGTLLRVKRKA